MDKKKRRVSGIVLVMALLLGGSIVYAALVGRLNVLGTVQGGTNIDAIITTQRFADGSGDKDSISLSSDLKTLNFTVFLDDAESEKTIQFKVKNTGNENLKLAALTNKVAPDPATGITVTWPDDDLADVTSLAADAETDVFSITVTWDKKTTITGEQTISADLAYEQAI